MTPMVAAALILLAASGERAVMHPLTPDEERVIVHKGTERPFSGAYNDFYEPGTYACKRCDAPLYRSESKFTSGCGWPAFDDEIPGGVKRLPDRDGRRTEILCARCGAHLGHVFLGEGFTPRNVRHCVNSISLRFVPAGPSSARERAIFAGGCFWGVEYYFQQETGVLSTRVGYIGGKTERPSYEDVCRGNTGHAEAVEIVYDPRETDYETLARLFFEIHDPTQRNRQGPDVGDQYRSAVFVLNAAQRAIALKLVEALTIKGVAPATEVADATAFWPAEEYHQSYYRKKNGVPYCHRREKRF